MNLIIQAVRLLLVILTAFLNLLSFNSNSTQVELYSNPSSGYVWEFSMDKRDVMYLRETHYKPDIESILSGNGINKVFTFGAIKEGRVNITFEYVKKQLGGETVASTYVYSYEVAPSGEITLLEVRQE